MLYSIYSRTGNRKGFQFLACPSNTPVINFELTCFIWVKRFWQDKFSDVRLVGERVSIFVILLDVAKLPIKKIIPFCTLTIKFWECLSPHVCHYVG